MRTYIASGIGTEQERGGLGPIHPGMFYHEHDTGLTYVGNLAGDDWEGPIAVAGAGSGAANRVTWWLDANTITSHANFTYNPAADPNLYIQAANAAHVPLVVRGAASQSANLLELQNSSAAVTLSATGFDSTTAFQINKEDTTNVFTVDTTNARVGIGTASPENPFHAVGTAFPVILSERTTSLTNDRRSSMGVAHSTDQDMTDGFGAGFTFRVKDSADSWNSMAAVFGRRDGGDRSGAMTFETYASGAGVEHLRITSAGFVGINQVSPGAMLQIDSSAAATKGLIVKGAASQSANLQEWQDSGGAIQANIDPLGGFVFNEQGADADCRIEGDTVTNLFKTDAGNDQVETHGGRIEKVTRIDDGDSPYTVLNTDHVLLCDTDGGAITVNLQAGVSGRALKIINCGSSGNDVTVDPNGAEELYGSGAGVSSALSDGEVISIHYDATEGWW